jgi:hypothetical protein
MRNSDVKNEIERMTDNLSKTNMNIDQLIEDVVTKLDKDPMDQMVDTGTIIREFTKKIVNECIKELEISRRCDPYTGNLYDCEYNTCIKEQIEVLKARFGVKE